MRNLAAWIRWACRVLIVVQAAGIAWCMYGVVKALLDDTPSDCGLTGKGLIPWFVIAMLVIGVLMLITWAVLRNSERRYTWFALLVVAFITTLPFTSQLMNWIRR